ncbi:uncharacterized protein V1518DRAFT_408600 [Limtongia smithiae]|uniref:uncharacterized protein n=1 Tax=Limtongia smithiae TaxID=1125753 RepID=UPI0034CFBC56
MSTTVTPTTTSLETSTATSSGVAQTSSAAADGGHKSTNSPLLFFIALGFGIVFANLWIVVVVKYCIRRRRLRARVLAATEGGRMPYEGYDDAGFDLGLLRPPPRRRREKKVLTAPEVDERFPIQKYKLWRHERERAGLSTAGGVASQMQSNAPSIAPSRPASIVVDHAQAEVIAEKDKDALTIVEQAEAEVVNAGASEAGSAPVKKHAPSIKDDHADNELQPTITNATTANLSAVLPDDEEYNKTDVDDVQTHPNVNPDLAETTGDICAICLEQLEDDDDIRGLTCGHAFHATCIEPWLTLRRACCPLCKADYFVPKAPAIPAPAASRRPEGHIEGVIPVRRLEGSAPGTVSYFIDAGDQPMVRYLTPEGTLETRTTRNTGNWTARFVLSRLPRAERERNPTPAVDSATVENGFAQAEVDERQARRERRRRQREEQIRAQRTTEDDIAMGYGLHGAVL